MMFCLEMDAVGWLGELGWLGGGLRLQALGHRRTEESRRATSKNFRSSGLSWHIEEKEKQIAFGILIKYSSKACLPVSSLMRGLPEIPQSIWGKS